MLIKVNRPKKVSKYNNANVVKPDSNAYVLVMSFTNNVITVSYL